jgi:multiple sugar transport system ATP-binding protein
MGDRIAVIDKGVIQQIGTPIEVYNNPTNKFVGGFLGSPAMNFINAKVENGLISLNSSTFELNEEQKNKLVGKEHVIVGIRAENFNPLEANFEFKAEVEISEMLGNSQIAYFKVNDCFCCASLPSDFKIEKTITLKVNTNNIMFFDSETTSLL